MHSRLSWIIAFILGVGILPSLTSLSAHLQEAVPQLFRYVGPINPLKILAPLLLYFAWTQRHRIPRLLLWLLGGGFALATLATLIAAIPCGFPAMLLREAAVMLIGALAGLSFILLSSKQQFTVLAMWGFAVYLSAFIDATDPAVTDWLYAHVFDPNTRFWDVHETGQQVLAGVFGRQSLAKLLAWLPWLLLAGAAALKNRAPDQTGRSSKLLLIGLSALAVISTGAILATSQRGPFVAAALAWIALAVHLGLRGGQKRAAWVSLSALFVSLILTALLVPRNVLEPRIRSLIGSRPTTVYGHIADANRDFRLRMSLFSLEVIAENPLGAACIPDSQFREANLNPAHSHNMILQQYRTKGWLWGSAHLVLWILAALGAWRTRTLTGSFMFAGISSVLISGMFDHPWFVLNHAVVLGVLLTLGLSHWISTRHA